MSRSTIQVLSKLGPRVEPSQASCSGHQTEISGRFTCWLQLTQMLEAARRAATAA